MGSANEDHADLIAHESAHAIGLLIQGHGVAEVRVDHDRLGELGRITADFSHSEADYGCLIAALMGPIAGGDPPPPWPPDRDSLDTDERNAAVLVEHLGLCHTSTRPRSSSPAPGWTGMSAKPPVPCWVRRCSGCR